MRPRPSVIALLFFISISLLSACHPSPSGEGKRTVKVAILPEYSLELMASKYMDLIAYLSRETGYRVEFVSSLSYTNYLSTVESSKADIGFHNALIHNILVRTRGAYPLCQVMSADGAKCTRGVVIVHRGSGIGDLSGIRGKRVMVISKRSVAAYLAPVADCLEKGIVPDRDFRLIIGTRQDEVVRKVLQHKVDAGFVREDVLRAAAKVMDISDLRVVHLTSPYPNWVISAFRETDPEVAARIKEALLRLDQGTPEGKAMLEQMGAKGFVEAQESDFEQARKLAAKLNLPL